MKNLPAFDRHARALGPISAYDLLPRHCIWPGCRALSIEADDELPVCRDHGIRIAGRMMTVLNREADAKPPADADRWPTDDERRAEEERWAAEHPTQHFVYYLMLSPVTVKIGTTRQLWERIRSLRTEMQYVVALERGGMELERQRHREFADERRHKLREDFHLSDALRRHIENLQPQRDELVRIATTPCDDGDTLIPPVVVDE